MRAFLIIAHLNELLFKFVFCKLTLLRFAPSNEQFLSFAFSKFALHKLALFKLEPSKLAPTKFIFLRSASDKSQFIHSLYLSNFVNHLHHKRKNNYRK